MSLSMTNIYSCVIQNPSRHRGRDTRGGVFNQAFSCWCYRSPMNPTRGRFRKAWVSCRHDMTTRITRRSVHSRSRVARTYDFRKWIAHEYMRTILPCPSLRYNISGIVATYHRRLKGDLRNVHDPHFWNSSGSAQRP